MYSQSKNPFTNRTSPHIQSGDTRIPSGIKQNNIEIPENVTLPSDDSDDWKYKTVDGKKVRTYEVAGTGSDQGGSGVSYGESYAKLTPEQKKEYPTIELWEDYVRDYNKSKNPNIEITQEAPEWKKPVSWQRQNMANFHGKTFKSAKDGGQGWSVTHPDNVYNWESRYRSGANQGDWENAKSYTSGDFSDSEHAFFEQNPNQSPQNFSNYDDVIGDWNFDWARADETGKPLSNKDIGRNMNSNRMAYMRQYADKYLANELGKDIEDLTFEDRKEMTQEQHDHIYTTSKNQWFNKLKNVYPNVRWGNRGKVKLQGTSGTGPYATTNVRVGS